MKKFYSVLFFIAFTTLMSYGQSVLILAADAADADILAIQTAVEGAWTGITSEIVDPAGVTDWDQATWSGYDACVLTESGGSSSHGHFAPIGIRTLPFVCLKAYAIKKSYPSWNWITSDADQWWQQTKDSSQTNYDYTYSGVVVADHPILGDCWDVDEEFVWTTAYNENEGDEAHVQCFDLKMSYADIADNATLIAKNKFAADETGSTVDGWLWAVEENDSSKAGVVWGIHHEFLNNATDDFFKIVQNSLAWVLAHDIPNICVSSIENNRLTDFGLEIYPSPASSFTNIEFNLEQPVDIYLIVRDVVGKTVYEMNESFGAGKQSIHLNVSGLTSGMYNIQLIAGEKYQSKLFMVR